jgi:hypothetical protein
MVHFLPLYFFSGRLLMRTVLAIAPVLTLSRCIKEDSIQFSNLTPKPIGQVELLPDQATKPFKVIGHVVIKAASLTS